MRCVIMQLSFVIRCVPDQYKTQEMHDKVILENNGTLMFVTSPCKNQEMCDKSIDTCLFLIDFIPDKIRLNKCVIKLFPKNLSC